MTEEQKVELRQKWKQWIKEIGRDLGDLLISQDFFNEVREIVASNEKIQSPSAFHGWIRDNYVETVVIRIVRLNDHSNRTISLHRVIKELSENPEVITRKYFVSRYPKWMQDKGIADIDFNKFAEETEQIINIDRLNVDIEILDTKTSLIKDYRNQCIAHFSKNREIQRLPTFSDIEEALKVIDDIFCKYYLLLEGGGMPTRKPVLQFDWKEPLKHAWIVEMSKNNK